ncbi:MAG: ATP-binding protein [Gemmatimonadota bacterium]
MRSPMKAKPLVCAVFVLAAYSSPARGQEPVTLRAAFADQNRDFIPDQKGRVVRVRAKITSGARVTGPKAQLIYAQDETRGVVLFSRDTTMLNLLERGDVVEVVGEVDQYRGMEQLAVKTLKLIGNGREVQPRRLKTAEAVKEANAGLLVRISGKLLVEKSERAVTVELTDNTGTITIFVSRSNLLDAGLVRRLEEGGRATVVGIVSQFDKEPPYDSGYELIPRDPSDWHFARPLAYRTTAWLGGLLSLMVLASYMYLQRLRAERNSKELRALTQKLERTNQELRHAQKMEAVGRLAGGVAHDFNNVLTAIIGHVEFVLDRLGPIHEVKDDLEEIRRSADRAASLTQQLLAFSRRQVLQAAVVDVGEILSDTTRMLHRLLGEDIVLTTRTAAKLPKVYADPVQLQQVVVNLAVNARDAMPAGGMLTIAMERFTAATETLLQNVEIPRGEYALITVEDTGSGMDEATRAAAFEPFFTTKPAGKGTGLGLSTVYGIVKQSGGFVFIDSAPGAGTKFRIYLPATSKNIEEQSNAAEAAPPHRAGSGTVLLVEDEAAVRALTARVLSRDGYTVISAGSGAEALALVDQHQTRVDLLLTDVVMPGMNGRELFQRLACRQPGLRVLFSSGYASDHIIQHHILDQSWPFLPKPYAPNDVRKKVAEVLEREPSSPEFLLESWQAEQAAASN